MGTRTNQFIYTTNIYSYWCGSYQSGSGALQLVVTTNYPLACLLTRVLGPDDQTLWSAGSFEPVAWTNTFPLYSGTGGATGNTNRVILSALRVLPGLITNALGETATLTFSGLDWLTSFKSFSGLTTTNIYYTNGFLAQSIDLEIARTNSFGYTSNGLVGTFTNELGLNLALTWDNLLRLTATVFPDGTYTSNRFDRLDLGGTRDRLSNWTSFVHDGARHLTSVTNANNAVTTYTWCGCGALESVLDALTNATVLSYKN